MRRLLVCVSLAALIASGCNQGSGSGGSQAAEQVDPAQLQSAVTDPPSRKFYEARNWAAAWNDEQAKALEQAIGGPLSCGARAL